ncbi:MAG: methyltransferase domain-containing protein [Octadecabacter sp.]
MTPEDIIPTYTRVAPQWDRLRSRTLFEKRWLDRMLDYTPLHGKRRRILDLGCGSGQPIASYLMERGAAVTGVDAAMPMVDLFAANLPRATVHHDDMRGLSLGVPFDAILAWDSFFHLSQDDQRAMFATFSTHAAPRAALMFTSGDTAGHVIGQVGGEPVYHASLAPEDYQACLAKHGFDVIKHVVNDPTCGGHTIWLARFSGRY